MSESASGEPSTRKRTRKDEIIKAYLMHGVEGVARLHDERGPLPKRLFRHAMQELLDEKKDIKPLEQWSKATYGYGLMNRGRTGAKIGEERTYKVTRYSKMGPHLRIPLSMFEGVIDGSVERFRIRFHASGGVFEAV